MSKKRLTEKCILDSSIRGTIKIVLPRFSEFVKEQISDIPPEW